MLQAADGTTHDLINILRTVAVVVNGFVRFTGNYLHRDACANHNSTKPIQGVRRLTRGQIYSSLKTSCSTTLISPPATVSIQSKSELVTSRHRRLFRKNLYFWPKTPSLTVFGFQIEFDGVLQNNFVSTELSLWHRGLCRRGSKLRSLDVDGEVSFALSNGHHRVGPAGPFGAKFGVYAEVPRRNSVVGTLAYL